MSKKDKNPAPEATKDEEVREPVVETGETPPEPVEEPPKEEPNPLQPLVDDLNAQIEKLKAGAEAQEDKYARLCAEYDNFRRRSQKEKEGTYADATADTVKALLPVYDNLERALKQDTADEAFKKGVEMTMAGLRKALESLGVAEIDAVGRPFDPNVHNAVMHIEDDTFGENTVAEVFQAGFTLGDKVIRFAMVKVAN